MTHDLTGWLWLLVGVGGVVMLGLALGYGIVSGSRMSARKRQQSQQATRDLYDHLHDRPR